MKTFARFHFVTIKKNSVFNSKQLTSTVCILNRRIYVKLLMNENSIK